MTNLNTMDAKTLQVNTQAVEYAKQVIGEGKWALNTVWSKNQPSPEAEAKYRAANGDENYGRWYLATENGNYRFSVGDFNRVHRGAVAVARRYGELNGLPELVAAADEILDLFDRMNAC